MFSIIYKVAVIHLLLLSFLFPGQIIIYQWGAEPTVCSEAGTDSAGVLQLDNWEALPGGQKLKAPFYLPGNQNLALRSSFAPLQAGPAQDVFLHTQGFPSSTRIFLNNRQVAFQPNDYIPSRIKLDKSLLFKDKTNTLKLEFFQPSTPDEGYPQYVHLFSAVPISGITRPVCIEIRPRKPVSGFSLSLQSVSGNAANVAFEYVVRANNPLADERLNVEEKISTPEGRTLYLKKYYFSGSTKKIRRTFSLPSAYLWSADNPQLLEFTFSVKQRDGRIFSEHLKTGVRKLLVKNKRLLLNSAPFMIRGINYHFDPAHYFKDGYFPTLKNHFLWIKQAGFNAVRLAHFMPDERMASLADSLGLFLFPELPVWRYPADIFNKDAFLKTIQSGLKNFKANLNRHPSIAAIGLGREIPLHFAASQKFMFILRDYIHRQLNTLSFLSPIPGYDLPPEKTTDLYFLDFYHTLGDIPPNELYSLHAFDLAGQVGLFKDFGRETSGSVPSAFHVSAEITRALTELKLGGCFIESFQDWHTLYPSAVTVKQAGGRFIVQSGFFDINGRAKADWQDIQKIWEPGVTGHIEQENAKKNNTLFSIVIFFASILYFSMYRRRRGMRDNFWRSMNHPYGFFVDIRERRIIPLANSFLIGAFAAVILSVIFASIIYFYKDALAMQEIFSHVLAPVGQYENFLRITNNAYYLITFLFGLFFIYPVIVSVILKFISLFTRRTVRYRQAIAIGMWSGLPLIFLLPLALVNYYLLIHFDISVYLYATIALFLLWAHYRILNGIRVLLTMKSGKVFIILFLSYITPLLILWAVQKPAFNFLDYLNLLLHSGSLF